MEGQGKSSIAPTFSKQGYEKDADGMANSVDPDQTAPCEQSDLGLLCLPTTIMILSFRTDTCRSGQTGSTMFAIQPASFACITLW